MASMYGVSVFPPQPVAQTGPVEIDYNQQLQDLIDSSNQVKSAVDDIDQASPVDITPVVTAINTQTSLIDSFKQQSDANQVSTKVAVEAVRTAVDQMKTTVETQTPLITDAIAQASADEQANLNAKLDATVGALQSALVNEFNESQALLTQQNAKLDELNNKLTGSNEAEVAVSLNVDSSDGPREVIIPAGWLQGDIGPNFRDTSGAQTLDGAAFDVEIGGRTEQVVKNGEWHRERQTGFMGKPVPTLGGRVVIKQAESTTHFVFGYPVSQAPAQLTQAAIVLGLASYPEFILNQTLYFGHNKGLSSGIDLSEFNQLTEIVLRDNSLDQIVTGDHPSLNRLEVQNQSAPNVSVSWPIAPGLRFLRLGSSQYTPFPALAQYPALEIFVATDTNAPSALDLSSHSSLKEVKVRDSGIESIPLGSHPDLTIFEAHNNNFSQASLDAVLSGLENAGLASPAAIRLDGNGVPSAAGLASVAALRAAGHTVEVDEPAASGTDLTPLVGNLYNSGDGAPYTDDLQGLYTAIQTGSTYADVTSGPDGVTVDTNNDGAGERIVSQAEYDALAAASQADIDAVINA